MSRNEEERGSFILPSAAVSPLRRALVEAVNTERAQALACATAVYDALQKDQVRLKELRQALKKHQGHSTLHTLIEAMDPTRASSSWRPVEARWDSAVRDQAIQMLLKYDLKTQASKLRKPLKMFALPVPSNTLTFNAGAEGSVSIEPATRTVSWAVQRNKRAIEDSRNSRVGQAFFKALQSITWTRGTGGHITATDEYSEDAARDNGHFNSGRTTTSMGPLGEAGSWVGSRPAKLRQARKPKV